MKSKINQLEKRIGKNEQLKLFINDSKKELRLCIDNNKRNFVYKKYYTLEINKK